MIGWRSTTCQTARKGAKGHLQGGNRAAWRAATRAATMRLPCGGSGGGDRLQLGRRARLLTPSRVPASSSASLHLADQSSLARLELEADDSTPTPPQKHDCRRAPTQFCLSFVGLHQLAMMKLLILALCATAVAAGGSRWEKPVLCAARNCWCAPAPWGGATDCATCQCKVRSGIRGPPRRTAPAPAGVLERSRADARRPRVNGEGQGPGVPNTARPPPPPPVLAGLRHPRPR